MSTEDAKKRITNQVQGCIERLGKETTQEMLDRAKQEDCMPICCSNCPYPEDCKMAGVAPWFTRCERYEQYKRTHIIKKTEPTIEQRLETLERAFYIFATRQHETNYQYQEELHKLLDDIHDCITKNEK